MKDKLDERSVLSHGDENEVFDGEQMVFGVGRHLRKVDDDLLKALDGRMDFVDKVVKLSREVVEVEHVVLLVCCAGKGGRSGETVSSSAKERKLAA